MGSTRIGLLSDTHGYVDPKIFTYFKEVDEIWHAGDIGDLSVIDQLKQFKPLRIVHGNIDGTEIRLEAPENLVFEVEGVKVVMTHIAGKPGKYQRNAYDLLNEHRPDLFVCGHSHILLVKMDPHFKTLWMNPGACGFKGFHQVKTVLRFNLSEGRIKRSEERR